MRLVLKRPEAGTYGYRGIAKGAGIGGEKPPMRFQVELMRLQLRVHDSPMWLGEEWDVRRMVELWRSSGWGEK